MEAGEGKEPPEKGTFKYYEWAKKNLKKSRNASYYKKDKQYKKDLCDDAKLRKRKQRELEKERICNEIHRKEMQNLRAKKYREKLKSDNIQQDIEFKNRMQKSRLIKKLKSALPQSPRRRLGVLKGYLTSRSPTVKTLGKCKIFETPKDNQERNSAESLIEDVRTILDNTKSKRTSQSNLCRKLIFSTVCGENIQKNNMKKTLAKKLGVKRTQLAAGSRTRKQILTTDAGWQITLRKTRNNNIPDTHKKIAYDYWLKAGNSRPTGNKKDIKRERLDTNVYISHMIQVLEKSQTEIYNDFREVYPEIKMSQSTFERLKPFYVRPVRSTDRNTCLCRYHVEIKSVLDSCMRERKKILERENNPVLSSRYPIFRNINDVVTSTLCNKADTEDNHDISCLKRECKSCGVHLFSVMDEENSDERVTWERFEYVSIPCKGSQERRKLMLVKKTTPMTELFSYFKDLLSTFPAHQFRATWQRQQLKHLTTNLPQNDCVTIHDFSENYRIASKDEIQSSYFQRTEVTLHVSILYRHATFEVDGIGSTPENPRVVTEQFLIFSNDEKHDHHFVHRAQEMIRDYLESISYRVNTMHEFTDGCPSQYKSRQCMGDVAHGCGDLGYERVIRNFFETSHAKGPQDAAGGYIKKQLDTAILRGKITINSAKDAYEYCKDNLSTLHPDSACTKRIFRYLESEGIKRQRNRNFRPIKHNRDVHQIITNGEGMLILRSHSCYSCDECACGRYELCMNKKITKPRLERMVTTDTCNTGDIEHESDFVQYSLAEIVKRGDLVVIYTDDQEYDYYLLKATHGFQRLLNDESDDWNNIFPKDNPVIRGHYYNKARGNNVYVLDRKKSALISANSVICIIHELKAMSKISIPENIHEDLISWIDECSV